MAESGCLRDVQVQNLNVENLEVNNMAGTTPFSRMMGFMNGFKGSIAAATGVAIDQDAGAVGQAAADFTAGATYTLVANAISTFAGDGSAATLVNLPAAIRGTFCVLNITGDIDETGVVTIQTFAQAQVFAHQHIHVMHTDNGGADHAAAHYGVVTAGNAAAPTSNELRYTAAGASTNFLGINSEIHFYCPVDNQWLVKVYGVSEGVGSTGVLTVAAV